MACEACKTKFTLFKRKKQCMDCLHYFCSDCVIRRVDRVLSCDNCSMLSRRPLIRSQILQMRSRHLRQYLEAKKVSVRGCLEKEDLVNLLMHFANGNDVQSNRVESNSLNQSRTFQQFSSNVSDSSLPHHSYNPSNGSNRTGNEALNSETVSGSMRGRQNSGITGEGSESVQQRYVDIGQTENSFPTEQVVTSTREPNFSSSVQTEQSQSNISRVVSDSTSAENLVGPISNTENESNLNEATRSMPNFGRECMSPSELSSEFDTGMIVETDDGEEDIPINRSLHRAMEERVEIEELSESEAVVSPGPEPVITESDDIPSDDVSSIHMESAEIFTEIHTWSGTIKLSDIHKSSDLECLTTKQLKYLLIANRVDFKGCVERYELLDRALRLWTEYKKSRKEAENSDMDALCKICLDAPIECVILECGHMACCIDCGKRMSECPICRQYIVRVVRFFRA